MKIKGLIKDLKIFFKLKIKKKDNSTIHVGISLELLWAVFGQFSFRYFLVPAYTSQSLQAASNVVSANYRVLICCTCHFQSSLLFILASVRRSPQCLISALTQEGEGGPLFRLTCSVVLRGGRNTANKHHWRVLGARSVGHTGIVPPTVCVLSWSTLLGLQVALPGNCLKWALGCVHFPGLSHSGSGSRVLHKGTDLVGPAGWAFPRSKQLR